MSGTARERANAAQRLAADPAVSAFVVASAGSGKTKLLTDRLLRLLLGGADPARIQCLTYTRAAAAEMALRLQATLGNWVTLPDAALDAALAERDILPGAAARQAARALFARVLDLPGGMRIGTIHAFCQSLLRRFPLEAQLSPHFGLLAEADAALACRAAEEDVLAGAHALARQADLATLAGLVTVQDFGRLATALRRDPERLHGALAAGPEALADGLLRALGGVADEPAHIAAVVGWTEQAAILEAARAMSEFGSATVRERGAAMLDWLAQPSAERAAGWPMWHRMFHNSDGKPTAGRTLVNLDLERRQPGLQALLAAEQARLAAVEDARRATRAAAASAALAALAAPVADAYAAAKAGAGLLDYEDLIVRTSALLVDPGAAWVLYKLDGGLDHLLLDEVQDTAPAQWRIAGALTAEFFAGTGAREGVRRTVFAVGDRKQSIYSFQGADPAGFETWRERLRARVRQAGESWQDVTLDVSFRSTAPVLELVDAVFEGADAAAGVVPAGEALRHHPDRAEDAGLVELWPLVPPPDLAPPVPWAVPERNLGARSAMQVLAAALAGHIAAATAGGTVLESRGRPLAPGDVLVLVRRRNAFARALVRALKARGVPVAGLDRLVLTEQPAVADLLALADALLLPQDDLAVACVLTSPLGGLGDDSLMALAAGRSGTLWEALRQRAGERPEWQAAWRFLAALFARVDHATPHALLAEALGPLGGRARLLGRLGPDAAEPIDEMLNAALAYVQIHPPSLQGFAHWLRSSGAEVKREAGGAGGSVRIMTVHGAKGLQAPWVILPDTTALPPDEDRLLWTGDAPPLPVWAARKELGCAAFDRLRAAAAQMRAEEYNRLLYVALTRAEDRVLVCGWQPRKLADECWYEMVRRGFGRLGAAAVPLDFVAQPWAAECWRHAAPQRRPPAAAAVTVAEPATALPAWAGVAPDWRAAPPPVEPALPSPLAPSRPQDAALGPVPQAASPLAARDATGQRFRRGRLVHALLQHLPALPEAGWPAAARRFLGRPGHALAPGEAAAIAAEVLAVLAHPTLAPLFGPAGRAEVPLTGVVAGRVIGGLVDRLAVLADRVVVADYKTNRAPPADLAGVPVLYLRQMAAYRAVLRAIHPGLPVRCALVWTSGAQVMELPDAALDAHGPGRDAAPAGLAA